MKRYVRNLKKVFKKVLTGLFIASYVSTLTMAAPAFGGHLVMATEKTQLMNNAKLAAQYLVEVQKKIQMVKMWVIKVEDMVRLPGQIMDEVHGEIQGIIDDAASVYQGIRGTIYQVAHLNETVYDMFETASGRDFDINKGMFTEGGLDKWLDYPTQLWNQFDRMEKYARSTLESISIDFDNLKDRADLLKKASEQNRNAEYHRKLIDANNQFLALSLMEAQQLNKTVNNMYLDALQLETVAQQRESARKAIYQNDMSKWERPAASGPSLKFEWGEP